jgi:transposase InsO family protein
MLLHKEEYSIAMMSEEFGVSREGYYKYVESKDKPYKYASLLAEMHKIIEEDEENENYGAGRMHSKLKITHEKLPCPRTIGRIMDDNGLKHEKKRKPNSITKADKLAQKSDNLLNRDFTADAPNEKFVTDITQVPTAEGTLYISGIFDCFDNTVWGLEMDDNMRKELPKSSLESAVLMKPQMIGAIVHSDRGSQYTSALYRETIGKLGINQSMNSAGGRCHDNAKCESMWARFKEEKIYKKGVNTSKMSMDEVKQMVFRYFYSYWNNRRICTAIGGVPPMTKRKEYFESLKLAEAA